jgi:hypothetical protein
MAGLLGPGADAESLVLGLINHHDRYLARRSCHARRRELGARTATLVLSEDEAGEAVLPSVDLASSFPSVRTLVLRCKAAAKPGWPERFTAFVSCNAAALQRLRHLDLGYGGHLHHSAPITSSVLAALAQLPGLQSLRASVDKELSPSCWSALGSLKQLTGLHVCISHTFHPEHLPHIVGAAPQLQELWTLCCFGPKQLACLTGLRSLSSLWLTVAAEAAPALRSLTALQGLTHLLLEGDLTDELVAAVGQLTGLVSLELWSRLGGGRPTLPLSALQRLTSLALRGFRIDEQQAQVLAGLAQLRWLAAEFDHPATAAAAGLARLEECKVQRLCSEAELQGGALVTAPGQLDTDPRYLACFDLSSVHTLELEECIYPMIKGEALCQQLSRCPQLPALMLHQASSQLEVLQAIAARCPSFSTCACMLGRQPARSLTATAWRCWPTAAGS